MPTYEYRCPRGHDFEKFYRKISDAAAEVSCPECGAVSVRQLSGGAGLVFKGSGFYLTDYGKNAHRKAAPATDAKGESKTGGEAGAEPKAAEPAGKESTPAAESKPADSAPSKPADGKPPAAPKKTGT
jgi:putative FmdB family regulatory protein